MLSYRKDRISAVLAILTICSAAGLQSWRHLFDNFSVNVVGLNGISGILRMVDNKIPFIAGAFFSFISLCLVQFIRTTH